MKEPLSMPHGGERAHMKEPLPMPMKEPLSMPSLSSVFATHKNTEEREGMERGRWQQEEDEEDGSSLAALGTNHQRAISKMMIAAMAIIPALAMENCHVALPKDATLLSQ